MFGTSNMNLADLKPEINIRLLGNEETNLKALIKIHLKRRVVLNLRSGASVRYYRRNCVSGKLFRFYRRPFA